jgi:cob(I)alamin adenosyltransferase
MKSEEILLAIKELENWRDRKEKILNELMTLSDDEKTEKKRELEKINEQIAYYESLIKDMKKEVKPPKIGHLLDAI